MKTESDTTENAAIVKRFIEEILNAGNFNLISEFWTADMTWHGGSLGEVHGIENYTTMLKGAASGSFKEMHLTVKDMIVSGERVVVYFTNSGLNDGDFLGFKSTGKHLTWDGIGIYRIHNGKIAEAWFSEDLLGMFLQAGWISFSK